MMDMNTLFQPKMKLLETHGKLKMTANFQEMVDHFGFQNTSILPDTPDITKDVTTTITQGINITHRTV